MILCILRFDRSYVNISIFVFLYFSESSMKVYLQILFKSRNTFRQAGSRLFRHEDEADLKRAPIILHTLTSYCKIRKTYELVSQLYLHIFTLIHQNISMICYLVNSALLDIVFIWQKIIYYVLPISHFSHVHEYCYTLYMCEGISFILLQTTAMSR